MAVHSWNEASFCSDSDFRMMITLCFYKPGLLKCCFRLYVRSVALILLASFWQSVFWQGSWKNKRSR